MLTVSASFATDPIYWQPPTTPSGLSNNLQTGVCYYDATVDKYIVINSKSVWNGLTDPNPSMGFKYYNYDSLTFIEITGTSTNYQGLIQGIQTTYSMNAYYPSQKYRNSACNNVNPVPTCTSNQILVNGKCQCKPGYDPDYKFVDENNVEPAGTCHPKINCPPQMQYFWTDQATDITGIFKTTYYTCVPRTDLSDSDCASQGGSFYSKAKDTSDGTSQQMKYMMMYGEGCVNEKWLQDQAFASNFSFLMSGFIIGGIKPFPTSLAQKAVSEETLLLEYKNKSTDVPLSKYDPVVEDLGMGSDGVVGNVGFNPKDPTLDPETVSAYNKFLKDNGYLTDTKEVPSAPVNDLGVDPSVTSKMGDNFYKGDDVTKFGDNMLGSANMASKGVIPDLSPATSAPVGATVATKIDLNKYLNKTDVQSYPVAVVKQSEKTNVDGSVATVYKGKVTYPDATVADFTVNQTKSSMGTVNEVGYSYIVNTANGTKTFNGSYTTTTDPTTGAVTNTVNKPSTVTQVNNDGSVSTSTNAGSNSVETDKSTLPLNLTNIQNSLNQMNKTLTETKELLRDLVQYVPANKTAFDQALLNFDKGFNNFSLKLNDFVNFIGGFPPLIDNFKSQLDDLLAMFGDQPSLSLPGGQCPFPAHWYGKDFLVDPCLYVRPYRPIISVFLTFFATWVIFVFVIKYMFRIGLRGE